MRPIVAVIGIREVFAKHRRKMIRKLSFANPNRGKQPRANALLRLARTIRRKRVAYARQGAANALRHAQSEIARVYQLAAAYDVPMDAMPALPALPLMPSQKWIEHLQDMGPLKEPVRPAPSTEVPA